MSAGPPAGVAGFIDALNALSSHLKERDRMEQDARRSWGSRALLCAAVLVLQAFIDLWVFSIMQYSPGTTSGFLWAAHGTVMVAGALAAFAAMGTYWQLATSPVRPTPDSADRVALRHEDSPVRDRIRIAQWILFDTALTRFAVADGEVRARFAGGLLAVGGAGSFALFLLFVAAALGRAGWSAADAAAANMGASVLFLGLGGAALVLSRRSAARDLLRAQHYARQVLAFDRAFSGFLPKVDREWVEGVLSRGRARGSLADSV